MFFRGEFYITLTDFRESRNEVHMFNNQNDSSEKFWVTAVIVGLLVFFGQFANSQVCRPTQAQLSTCKNWDNRSCRCMATRAEGDSRTYDTKDGQCKARLNGSNGCYSVRSGSCQIGPQFCNSADFCRANMPKNGNYWDGSNCRRSPVPKKEETAQEEPENKNCKKSNGVTWHANHGGGSEPGQCICNNTNQPAVSGKCATDDAPKKTASQKCEDPAIGGKWQQQDAEETSGYCLCPDGLNIDPVQNASAKCQSSNNAAKEKCASAGGKLGEVIGSPWGPDACVCEPGGNVEAYALPEGGRCEQTTAATGKEEDDAKFNRILKECEMDEMQERIDKCKEDSGAAVEKCEKEAFNQDKTNKELGAVMQLVGQVQQKKAVETGAAEVCGKVAYGTAAAFWALDLFKKTCEDEIKTCKESCQALKEGESFKALSQKCEQAYNVAFDAPPTSNGRISRSAGLAAASVRLNANRFGAGQFEVQTHEESRSMIRGLATTMEKNAKDNIIKCETDAVAKEADVGKYLAELLGASIGAANCKNAASNDAVRCAQLAPVLSPIYCQNKPTETCCRVFTGIPKPLDCNGGDYANKQCVCARSPDSTGCKVVSTTPALNLNNPGGVSGLAAPGGLKAGNQYKPSGVITQGGIDLNDSSDPGKPQQQAGGGGAVNPFGVASGGGGAGGGGLPSSPNDGAPGAAPAEGSADKGLVGGAFNQLKTLADRMFGTGSGNSNGKGYGNTGKDDKKVPGGVDPNKWKPGLRGLAGGGSPFGPRNKDIWKIMNAQYGIQNHTFIGIDGK